MKKAPKKRIAAILEPNDEEEEQGEGDTLEENEEEKSSDTEDLGKSSVQFFSFCNYVILAFHLNWWRLLSCLMH